MNSSLEETALKNRTAAPDSEVCQEKNVDDPSQRGRAIEILTEAHAIWE